MERIEALKKIGCEWQKNGMHRIYFNDLSGFYGLETKHYNSGNICYATMDGEKISNSEARRIAGRFACGKLWFDVTKNDFSWRDLNDRDALAVVAEINRRAVEMEG